MNPKVDIYFNSLTRWRKELLELRTIVLDCGLTEELKWGVPCYYTFGKANVVGLNGLKGFCAMSFFKGVLLEDGAGILTQPGVNTQAGRWIKFKDLEEISGMEGVLKAYIHEAMEVEIAGVEVRYKETSDFVIPCELVTAMDDHPAFRTAFEALTPGRQRGFILHFSGAKQAKTREERIGKCVARILDGKGLHDCTCGRSRKMPACDGSHKFL